MKFIMGLNESFIDIFKKTPKHDKSEEERFTCVDCGEYDYNMYMVNNDIWDKYGEGLNTLCLNCLEQRMGHKISKSDISDFKNAPVNIHNPDFKKFYD
jgi:hypothetical protein